tara:strand:+ start:569 stop:904 length:336 start_codon:yes stop_codon:yes gene_type:complete
VAKEDKKHSKYYYEYDRNMSTTLDEYDTEQNHITRKDEDLKIFDDRVPEYYKGKNGYEARKVCDNFDLTYHLATAVTYLLRAYSKHESPVEDITKAIAHLEFELEKIKRQK